MPLKKKHSGKGQRTFTKKLCRCIKAISKTHKNKEKAAIPICIVSVLGSRGRTIKRFNCGRGILRTQVKK